MGRVTGCVVLNFGWWNHEIGRHAPRRRYRQGYDYPNPSRRSYPDLSQRSEAYADLLYQGRRAAAARMAAQCPALGGDGVVGVRIDVASCPRDRRDRQFTATGTAVRAEGGLRAASPFLAALTAQDFTTLLGAGWVPADIAVGTACTYGSWSSGTAPRRWDDGNRELERWTGAVALAREQARDVMQADAARSGAEGVVLGAMDARATVHNLGPWRGAGGYCVAEATVIGTAITQFRPSRSPQRLPVVARDLRASDTGTAVFSLSARLNERRPRSPSLRIAVPARC